MTLLRDSLFKNEGFKNLQDIVGLNSGQSIIPMGDRFAIVDENVQIISYFQLDQNGFLNLYDSDLKQIKQITSVSNNQFQFYNSNSSISNTVFFNDSGNVFYNLDFDADAISVLSDSFNIDEDSVMDTLVSISEII